MLHKTTAISVALISSSIITIPAKAADAELKTKAVKSDNNAPLAPTVSQESLPPPFLVKNLSSLTAEQKTKIQQIFEKHQMDTMRQKFEQFKEENGLAEGPPGMGMGGDRQGPPGMGQSARRQGPPGMGAAGHRQGPPGMGPGGYSEGHSKIAPDRAKLRAMHEEMRTHWQAAWNEIKPLLNASQIAEIQKKSPMRNSGHF
ncbi:MAG: hypothetical protein K2X27_11450 [Candidatus Obscuribacterales bacterium]|nr:hypothetical protein [Candidatus Obscuribacterales bacterium]